LSILMMKRGGGGGLIWLFFWSGFIGGVESVVWLFGRKFVEGFGWKPGRVKGFI